MPPFDDWHSPTWREDYPDVPDDAFPYMLARAWAAWHGHHVPRGLLAKLNLIRFQTPEGRAGRPADAVGVSADTWNKWLARATGLRDRKTGKPLGSAPSKANMARIDAVLATLRIARPGPAPTRLFVCSVLVWDGYQNGHAGSGGKPDFKLTRCTTLDGLALERSSAAWVRGDDWAAAQSLCAEVNDRYGAKIDMYEVTHMELKP